MRLIVMGQQAFGKDVLEKIIQKGVDEVVAVYCDSGVCASVCKHEVSSKLYDRLFRCKSKRSL